MALLLLLCAVFLVWGSPSLASVSQLLSGGNWKLSNANRSIHIPASGGIAITRLVLF
jgi:hypothetical protein